MRSFAFAAMVLAACGGGIEGSGDDGAPTDGDLDGGDDGPLAPGEWRIDVDPSFDRFVPAGTTTWTVSGTVRSSEPLAGVDVAGAPATLTGDAFTAEVPVGPGLQVVPIVARDTAGHARQAHRSLIALDYLPEGTANRDAAAVILTDAILAEMSGGLTGDVTSVDVAGEILARDILSQDDQCVTWPVSARQGAVTADLVRDDAELWLHIRVPQLYVYFEGQCQGPLRLIPIGGEMAGSLDVWTRLDARAPTDGACITSFDHTPPAVTMQGWRFGVWGLGGPLQNWIIQLFSGNKADEARAQIVTELRTRADELLTEKLANISVFDNRSTLSLLDRPVDLALCLAALEPMGDQLVARIAASAQGTGTLAAPGAPLLAGPVVAPGADELVLDSNLIAQSLFSAWRAGGVERPNLQQVELSLLEILLPGLTERFPGVTMLDVSITGELPAVVRATPDVDGADLRVELGDLRVDLTAAGAPVLTLGVHLILDLDLVPTAGTLVPTVVRTTSKVTLLAEIIDGDDESIEDLVGGRIAAAASDLLAGSTISLPALPGLGVPADVAPDAGGRFVRVRLQ